MSAQPERHHRRSIRLPDYDYRRVGAYFVTICTYGRECLFGEALDGTIVLNELGTLIQEEWLRSAEIRKEISLDAFVVMPNHVHGVIGIDDGLAESNAASSMRKPGEGEEKSRRTRKRSLGDFVSAFKAATTRRINLVRGTPGVPVWQRNYYEHVVRKSDSLDRIRQYIADNPARWNQDRENPGLVDLG